MDDDDREHLIEEYYEIKRVDAAGRPKDVRGGLSWKTKMYFGFLMAAGAVIGTFLFLFFMALFFYLFLPLLAVFLVWMLVGRRRFR